MVFYVFSSLVRAYLFLVLCSFSFICGISEIIGTEGRRNSLLDKASDMKFKRVANGVGTYGNYHKNFSEIILQICHKTDSVQSGTMTFHKKQKKLPHQTKTHYSSQLNRRFYIEREII